MYYSRRQFLKLAAAGLPVAAAAPLLLHDTAYAEVPPRSKSQGPGKGTEVLGARKPYDQVTADEIHDRSVEREVLKAGKTPGEVRTEADRRIHGLKMGSIR